MVFGKLNRYVQKNETRPTSKPYTRINSKWIKDLNISLEVIKLLEENIGSKISYISHGNIFFSDISPKERETKKN